MWRDGRIIRMGDDDGNVENNITLTSEMRYYYRNRDIKIAKDLARYHNNPNVIAKKEERERKKAEKVAEKEAEKEAKRIEKERIRQEKLELAEATKRVFKSKPNENK
jgi:hypothetical protein